MNIFRLLFLLFTINFNTIFMLKTVIPNTIRIPKYRIFLEDQNDNNYLIKITQVDDHNVKNAILEIINMPILKSKKAMNRVTLDLSRNKLTKLPEEIAKISGIRHLNLSHNCFIKIPEKTLSKIKNLSVLNLSDNQIEQIHRKDCICFKYLKELNLSYNKIHAISSKIRLCQLVEIINLKNNSLEKIPGELGHLNLLKILILFNNQITTLPKDLGPFRNTHSIYFNGNELNKLSDMVKNNRSLFNILIKLYKNSVIHYKLIERIPVESTTTLPPELVEHIYSYWNIDNLTNPLS